MYIHIYVYIHVYTYIYTHTYIHVPLRLSNHSRTEAHTTLKVKLAQTDRNITSKIIIRVIHQIQHRFPHLRRRPVYPPKPACARAKRDGETERVRERRGEGEKIINMGHPNYKSSQHHQPSVSILEPSGRMYGRCGGMEGMGIARRAIQTPRQAVHITRPRNKCTQQEQGARA